MRYDEFRDQFEEALCDAALLFRQVDRPSETIDLETGTRRWRAFVWRAAPQRAEPFHVSARISFEWSPFDAARSHTCEEDLLKELFGRRKRPAKTDPRILRVDFRLYAKLPYGSTTPMPEPQVFGPWIATVGENIDRLLLTETNRRGGCLLAVMGGREHVKVEARCAPEGILSIESASLSTFRMVQVPRVWDDPKRRAAEKGVGEQLGQLARRFKGVFDAWTGSIGELATWIRYSPPSSVAGSAEGPPFEEEEEDDERGTVH